MPAVEVRNLVKQFGKATVVNDLSISVEKGEIVALLGASGCGKTTTLRCIAGLENPTSGEIWIDGKLMTSSDFAVPAEKRGIGMIFQSYAIWPHMTVFDNVAYGLRVKHMRKQEVSEAVNRTLDSVMLDGLADRYPAELSGGQQQRVALARSIVCEPAVLLLDEPLSNLDAKLREQMRDELRELIKRVGITAIHITHDQVEAMAIADRIAIMKDGVILQEGAARELYRRPGSRFIAEFVGDATFLDCQVEDVDQTQVLLVSESGLRMWSGATEGLRVGDSVSVSLRPEYLKLRKSSEDAGPNHWLGTITAATFLGSLIDYRVQVRDQVLRVTSLFEAPIGSEVDVLIDVEDVAVLPREMQREAGELAKDLAKSNR